MSAILSACGGFRYRLSREWSSEPKLGFIMLNPSTADAEADDPTIRRCIRYARDGGYGGIIVGNLYAWRATDPAGLRQAQEPIGPDNDAHLNEIIREVSLIVCAWGGGAFGGRDLQVLAMIRHAGKAPHCLKMTGTGHPSHPLYLPAALRPIPLTG